jgi:hypothetical protein
MGEETAVTLYEPSAWMRQAVADRLTAFAPAIRETPVGTTTIILMLTELSWGASDEAKDRWERSCDRCDTYCEDGRDFYTGSMTVRSVQGHRVSVTFGLCPACQALEGIA